MRMLMLGAASIALATSPVFAEPGKGNGGGGGQAAEKSQGNGGGKSQAQSNGKADRGGPQAGRPVQAERQPKGNARQGAEAKSEQRTAAREDRARPSGNGKANAGAKQVNKGAARASNGRSDNRQVRPERETREARDIRYAGRDPDVRTVRVADFGSDRSRGLIQGCPPGLAKKNNGCTPPGLERSRDGYDRYYSPDWFGYSSLQDGRYRYGDGYLYRTSNTGSVLGFLPLLGGALSVGNPWPDYYQPAEVPDYYVQYYNLGSPNSYRYADDVFYRVDPQSDSITSIAALLTGDRFAVGQPMPAGYDVYNVPYGYQDQYYDTPEYDYRYADGYVYQVDPTTQLIQAAIELLT
ncbi:hypothetical protein [Altererythrobacter sp. TH136]|uniref:hypothetical protein n=1 Tax=Altererythrobacter sp. TH136 TaxID=2067415 RepID=UPI0011642A0A|nr:hypothetical protein [Altererythrobacter sp. TH136]QDM41610.1 hypothetical protein C0V74_11600 [Altererythrobacter sp. TH136]